MVCGEKAHLHLQAVSDYLQLPQYMANASAPVEFIARRVGGYMMLAQQSGDSQYAHCCQ
jgi:hypothetical protein